jgi:excisionase family DNA binding protein
MEHGNNDLLSALGSARSALTVSDVATLLKVTKQSVYRAATRGTLPSFRIGGSLRFNASSVAARLRELGAE